MKAKWIARISEAYREAGITQDLFWQLTPAETYNIILDAKIESYRGYALICATIANVNRSPSREAYSADDFMPKRPPSQKEIELKLATIFNRPVNNGN